MKVIVYLFAALASGGIFFIRDDWPFGFDGAYLAVMGVLSVGALTLVKASASSPIVVPKLGTCPLAFVLWFITTSISAAVASIAYADPQAGWFLIIEMSFLALVFAAGYAIVAYFGVCPVVLIYLSSIWVIVAGYAVLDGVMSVDAVRRIKALASVNYMAASFSAYLIFCLASYLYLSNSHWFRRAPILVLAMAALIGVVLSGSRSAYMAVVFSTLLVTTSGVLAAISSMRLRKATLWAVVGAGLLISGVLGISVVYFADVNFNSLIRRLAVDQVMEAGIERANLILGFPVTTSYWELILGRPDAYALYEHGTEHPHNILVSTWRFGGVFSLVAIGLFFFFLALESRRAIRSEFVLRESRDQVIVLSLTLIPLIIYAMASGHYTRHWHVFWVAGLLSGYLATLGMNGKARFERVKLWISYPGKG